MYVISTWSGKYILLNHLWNRIRNSVYPYVYQNNFILTPLLLSSTDPNRWLWILLPHTSCSTFVVKKICMSFFRFTNEQSVFNLHDHRVLSTLRRVQKPVNWVFFDIYRIATFDGFLSQYGKVLQSYAYRNKSIIFFKCHYFWNYVLIAQNIATPNTAIVAVPKWIEWSLWPPEEIRFC